MIGTAIIPALSAMIAAAAQQGRPCTLPDRDHVWLSGALAAWESVRVEVLRLPSAPRPPLLLFDDHCVYEVAPEAMSAVGREYADSIALPNGRRLPPQPIAFASLAQGDTTPFLVVALEPVWSRSMALGDWESWPGYLTRAFVHEMTHARQLAAVVPELRVLAGMVGLEDFEDDVIQDQFDTVPGFRRRVQRETNLLLRAAETRDTRTKLRLTREALAAVAARREAYYGGDASPWTRLEQRLLDLEGVAEWAALAHMRRMYPHVARRRLIDTMTGRTPFWSQQQGLALFLLLDALVPDWQASVFTAYPRTSLELLEEALQRRDR